MYKFEFQRVEKDNPHYDPESLLGTIMCILDARNDRQLADRLGVSPSQVCKVRKRQLSVSPALLITMHEESGFTIRQLRALMGDFREHTGPSAKHPDLPQLQFLNGVQPQRGPRTGRRDGMRVTA